MKIAEITATPLLVPYHEPFHWAHGVIYGAEVVLVEARTDEGITGYGESIASPCATAIAALIRQAGALCVGENPFRITRLVRQAYQHLFAAHATGSAPRFGAQVLAGLDMALWDIAGKACGWAVHELMGGAVRDHIAYFGFPQGDTPEAVAAQARRWVEQGAEVIYIKIGRGEERDVATVQAVREAIGDRRLRCDANEAWDPLTAARLLNRLAPYAIEFIEQPTPSDSLAALAQVRAQSSTPIAADQLVFTPEDVFNVCRDRAADVIVLGLHETMGVSRFRQAAGIAQAAGVNVCLHGLYETGITTCAANQVGATLPNLDDGNQYMVHFLQEDIVAHPKLALQRGKLPVIAGPGWGFELDWDAVDRAKRNWTTRSSSGMSHPCLSSIR